MPFKILWAPWRLAYVMKADEQKGCIFCEKPKEQRDRENLIVARFERCFVILNAIPLQQRALDGCPIQACPVTVGLDR